MRARRVALGAYVGLAMLFLLAPLVVIVLFSFNRSGNLTFPIDALSTRWYSEVWNSPVAREAAKNSFLIGGIAIGVVALIGTPAAWAVARYRFRGRGLLLGLSLVPAALPGIFIGTALFIFFIALGEPLTLRTAAIAHVLYVLVASSRFAGLDPAIEEASRTLGASRVQTIRLVLLPQVRDALLGALALSLALSLDEFVITLFAIGNDLTVPILIFTNVRTTVTSEINVLATILLVVSWILVGLAALLVQQRSRRRASAELARVAVGA